MQIAIIGTGYVGLTTGTCFAELGHNVVCVDIDQEKIENLKKGIIPIYEPGLEELVIKNSEAGRLKFTTDSAEAIKKSEVVFSAVGTPPGEDYSTDLRFVKEVAKTFGQNINDTKIFINKSTVPVGTTKICQEIIQSEITKRKASCEFHVVSNPEFLREGCAISDTLKPDRIVVGYESDYAKSQMEKVYEPFGAQIVFTNIATAEVIKYAANSMLATRISFINEIANFCDLVDADVTTVSQAIGMDKRIGPHFLNAGIGYGGSCFPKDVQALIHTGKEHNHDFQILKAVTAVNKAQKELLFHKLQKALPDLQGKKIAIWGLSFKPNTDDMREAPSITIINKLLAAGAQVSAYDPVAGPHAANLLPEIEIVEDKYTALTEAHALLIVTEWQEFIAADLNKIATTLKTPLLLDGRKIFKKADATKAGLTYVSI